MHLTHTWAHHHIALLTILNDPTDLTAWDVIIILSIIIIIDTILNY